MELYDPILPSITWMYIGFILRVVWMITVVVIVCAIAIYYSVLLYRARNDMQKTKH